MSANTIWSNEPAEVEIETEDGTIIEKLTGDDLVIEEMRQREQRAVMGNSEVITHRGAQRDAKKAAGRAHEHAQRVLAGGGDRISTALVGAVGRRVAEKLNFAETARMAKALIHRVDEEVEDLERQQQERARWEKLDEILAEAWKASASKLRVPSIVGPLSSWDHHERPKGRPRGYASDARQRIIEQHAMRNRDSVLDALDELNEIILAEAQRLLKAAGSASDTLSDAGLSVDTRAEDIIEYTAETGDSNLLVAHRSWKEWVGLWEDLQSARRWISCAIKSGFDLKRPEAVITSHKVEAEAWRGQFEAEVLSGAGAHEALAWWATNGMPAAVGVKINNETEGPK